MCIQGWVVRALQYLLALPVVSLLLAAGCSAAAAQNDRSSDQTVVIVAGGDLGFGGSDQPLHAKGGYRHGRLIAWRDIGRDIAPLLNGDINFANLETVVTGRNTLKPANKKFRFQMHAEGLRRIIEMGFNVLSTANNHSRDYGQAGMRETLRHLSSLKALGTLRAFPGIGQGRTAALRPAVVAIGKSQKIAIGALGIGGTPLARNSKGYGQIGYHSTKDFSEALDTLAETAAGYRILSVHYGSELQLHPSSYDIQRLRDRAVRVAGVDLVIGHHSHVPAGVQMVNGKLILYGLGNLLHFGMQNMGKFNACRDFGLMARIFLSPNKTGHLQARAIQMIPLTDMHQANARPVPAAQARKRIAVLNGLASHLTDTKSGAQGLRFAPQTDGTGLYCFDGADKTHGKIAKLCRNWTAADTDTGKTRFPVHPCAAARPAPRTTALSKKARKHSSTSSKKRFVAEYFANLEKR